MVFNFTQWKHSSGRETAAQFLGNLLFMLRLILVLLTSLSILLNNAFAATKEVPITLIKADLELGFYPEGHPAASYQIFTEGNSFFVLDTVNDRLMQVNSDTGELTTILSALESARGAPAFQDALGRLYILTRKNLNTLRDFAVVNLRSNPTTYATRSLPAELANLESFRSDTIDLYAGAATQDGRIVLLTDSSTIHVINSDDTYAGGFDVTESKPAERVFFAMSPKEDKIAVSLSLLTEKHDSYLRLYDLDTNGITASSKAVFPKTQGLDILVYSKNSKNIYVASLGKGVVRFQASNLGGEKSFKSSKSSNDDVFKVYQGNGKTYAVFLKSPNKLHVLLKNPNSEGIGTKVVAQVKKGLKIRDLVINNSENKALITAIGKDNSNEGHIYLVDLK